MKDLFAGFVTMSLLFYSSVFTTVAQDNPEEPVPCDVDQVNKVLDLALPFGDQMNTVSLGDYPQTLDGDISKMLDWSDLYLSFFNDVYPELPNCIDGLMYGDAVGLMLNRQMTLEAMIVLNDVEIAMNSGDGDFNQAMTDVFQIRSDFAQQGVTSVNNIVNQLMTGTGISGWFPVCTPDQLEFMAQLDAVEEAYAIILPFLQTYLDEGTVHKNIYIGSMNIVTALDVGINNLTAVCSDYYLRLVNDAYLYGDTLTTLTLAQIALSMSGNVNTDRFDALLQYYNDALYGYVTDATATADS